MGTFTMPLHEVMQLEHDSGNGFRIGLASYPIWKPEYRDDLNRKIIAHYWNREIGLETISQFVFNLQRRMNEIMPLYNQVYRSTEIEFDPLATVNLVTEREDTGKENATGSNTSESKVKSGSEARTVNSEFPQGQLSRSGDYATSASDAASGSESDTDAKGESDSETITSAEGTSRTSGFQGAASDLLLRYRATLLNVDMMIIAELADLFMGIWSNEDELLPNHYGRLEGLGYGY